MYRVSALAPHVARWIESVTGVGVEAAERLIGGMSSDVHRCRCSDGSTFVIRHITNTEWLAREPDLVAHEATALDVLAGSAVPAPRHIASDPDRGLLLMSFLPGRIRSRADELRGRSQSIARAAATIAEVELPASSGLESWRSWAPDELVPPAWGDERLWAEAIEVYRSQPTPVAAAPVLLHRDLHPLNLLWIDDEIVGVVDWVNACVGHPHAELGHCRWNLTVLAGQEVADSFLGHYLIDRPGEAYDPWWDLSSLMSLLGGPMDVSGVQAVGRRDLTVDIVVVATELFVRSALARC